MKVTQEKLPDSQLGLEIEISGDSSRQKYNEMVQNLAKNSNIPGFRKGKVPQKVLLQRIGEKRIKAAVIEELIQENLQAAIAQENIELLGEGKFKLRSDFEELVQKYQPGESFTFSATVELPPEVNLGDDYTNIQVQAEETVYNPESVDELLEQKRSQKATLIPVEGRAAQVNDLAVIDYLGKEPDSETAIEGVEGKDFAMELISDKFIPGFVDGIVGMNVDETKNIPLTFPEDYPQEDLAGKAVVFEITLKELKEKELPELNDEFAQDISEFETIAELRASLEEQYKEQAERETKQASQQAIIDALVEKIEIDLPESMLDDEINQILTQTAMQIERMGIDYKQVFTPDSIPKLRENAKPEAIKKVKERLILQTIAKQELIAPTEEQLKERIDEVKEQLKGQNIDEERLKAVVFEEILTEKTLDWLQEKATVELVPKGTLTETETETETESTPETEEE